MSTSTSIITIISSSSSSSSTTSTTTTTTTKAHREASFNARLRTIKAHNADVTQTYKRGVNHLTDRTIDEL